jgi:hypothetical protein
MAVGDANRREIVATNLPLASFWFPSGFWCEAAQKARWRKIG